MSADLLREAAASIRDDYEREDVDDLESAELHLAVADWLEAMADYIELVMAGHPGWKASVHHAEAIARAYLGRSS